MSLKKLNLALTLALLALPMSVMAQEETTEATQEEAPSSDAAADTATESNLTWNLALTSDYVFRGVSQTNKDGALQGGLDYAFGDSGFYAGVWGSNVDFADRDGPDIEVDGYIGYATDLSDDWNLDVSVTRYSYYGARDVYGDIDYNELIGKLAYSEMLTFTLGYTNDYANSGEASTFVGVDGSWDIGSGWKFDAGIGHTNTDNTDNYTNWNVGVNRDFGPVNAALGYYDTDIDDPRVSDAFVLTLSIGG
ncbi:TorF family putative porin [Arenimonas oryziterrae]|uniref:Porin domain-containing protein n=1 Tax=Arenimonas oryziterrae DSM 21050 = YC6267 TaxID=1121015 RepID=A0A091AQP4_9GAMM|nr:TorF family putative porin [Arenimonas oryziterrae]KFN41432.1 hypothetical protein N789_06020 [Arenimonas oryziterrae DSM 21050 = YC6267]